MDIKLMWTETRSMSIFYVFSLFILGRLWRSGPVTVFHLPLLARIEAFRVEVSKDSGSSHTERVERLEGKLALSRRSLKWFVRSVTEVLSQNLQLWERVRELERKRPTNSTCIRLPT
jgi:hypothetical protein